MNKQKSIHIAITLILTFTVGSLFCQSQELTFFGNGNIQKSLDKGDKIPASTGIGVNYTQLYHPDSMLWGIINKLEFEASINIASTVDTIRAIYNAGVLTNSSDFGTAILTPLNSGQAVKTFLKLNFNRNKGSLDNWQIISGFKAKYTGSNRNWYASDGGSLRLVQGTNNAFRVGLFHEFLPMKMLNNYSVNLGAYLAYNSIKGDVGQRANDTFRSQILGTKYKSFVGPEINLEIRLKNLRAEFGYTWLRPNVDIPGLTGSRLVTTISFVGGFGLKL